MTERFFSAATFGADRRRIAARVADAARAWARLDHPGILRAREVLVGDDGIRVRVDESAGKPLRAWLAAAHRGPRAIAAAFAQVARALAAAHRAGVSHGALAPEVILVDDAGRAQLTDVAVAAALLEESRDDQRALATTLHEALAGRRPDGEVAAPTLPRRLRRAIEDGLGGRFADLDAFAAALDRSGGPSWRALALAAAAVIAATVVALLLLRARRGCAAELDGVWDDALRARVRAAFTASGRAHAPGTLRLVEERLDAKARRWATERCADPGPSRSSCLDRRRIELGAAVQVLAEATPAVVDAATVLLARLPDADSCVAGPLPPPPPDEQRDGVRAAWAHLARARVLNSAARLDDALAEARAAAEAARAARHDGTLAEAERTLADVYVVRRESAAAGEHYDAALALATAIGEVRLVAEVEIARLALAAREGGQADEVRRRAESAEAAVRRAGDTPRLRSRFLRARSLALRDRPLAEARADLEQALALSKGDDELQASLLGSLGNVLRREKKLDDALRVQREALELSERVYGQDHPFVASALLNVAGVHDDLGRHAVAEELLGRALTIQTGALGPESAEVGTTLNSLGVTAFLERDLGVAAERLERALAVRRKVLGDDSPFVAITLLDLARVERERDDGPRAADLAAEALLIREKKLGVDDGLTAEARVVLADALAVAGRPADAEGHARRGLALLEQKQLSPDVAAVARATLAGCALARGARAAAAALAEQALVGGSLDELHIAATRAVVARATGDRTAASEARTGLAAIPTPLAQRLLRDLDAPPPKKR